MKKRNTQVDKPLKKDPDTERDIVEESEKDSFPASDPPPWTLGVPTHKDSD